jgi:UDP-glucose-4-epimerase GalE
VKWGPLEIGDIADGERLSTVLMKYCPHAIIHFAAFAYVGESVQDPQKYYENNVAGTLSLLKAMHAYQVDKIIFSSSCAVYGIPFELPISESHLIAPINPYGHTKAMVEQMLRDFDAAYGIKSYCLRYFNAAGADPDGDIGEMHDPETHIIPLALDVAAGRRPFFAIYGDDYDTRDGSCIRDYIHVSDLAQAHVKALRCLIEKPVSSACNLGFGRGFSVKDIIELCKKVTGKSIKIKIAQRRPGDPPTLLADAEKASEDLKWKPQFEIDTAIESAWSWLLKTENKELL